MPELTFKGKEFVYNHHLSVPFRPLVPHPKKSIGKPDLGGNLIIHGDNLHALKALLPIYAAKVDCIYIDPPYNTGSQEWAYDDNVNSPVMLQWLRDNPVNAEDMLRHDKWLCMMWPRLVLLRELLAESGTFWMSIDEGESHRAKLILDEVFGDKGLLAEFAWKSRASEDTRATSGLSMDHEYILCYRKNVETQLRGSEKDLAKFSNPDGDKRGDWRSADLTGLATRKNRPNLHYDLINPATKVNYGCPPKGWRFEKEVMDQKIMERRILWPESRDGRPRHKLFLKEMKSLYKNISSVITSTNTSDGTREVNAILGSGAFPFPKPTALIRMILEQATEFDSIVLDSFAGSGTTGHAVLSQNESDGGNRKFLLVECEEYADKITAERIRRIVNGYKYSGVLREELLREPLTFTCLKKAPEILDRVAGVENLESHRFDKISKKVKDGMLIVEGEKQVKNSVEGLGGEFTYCTLGDSVDLDKLLKGESLPSFESLGAVLFHTATSEAHDPAQVDRRNGYGYLGESSAYHVWLIYKPDLDFLKSRDAALTLSRAEEIAKEKPGKRHLVFAPAKYVSNKMLEEHKLPVEHAPLPFALYHIERS